tara:strand:+ start:957 stop:1997 length:1041 start_codon:yes stop_codon:yes gene_type:complete
MNDSFDEINIIEILRKVLWFLKELKKKRWSIFLFAVFGSILIGTYAFKQPPVFIAQSQLHIDQENIGGLGGVLGLVGKIGLGNKKGGALTEDKLLTISKAKPVVIGALLQEYTKDSTLMDLYLKLNSNIQDLIEERFDGTWKYPKTIDSFSREDWYIGKKIYDDLILNKIKFELGEDGVVTLEITSNNPEFSVEFNEKYLDKVNKYFIKKNTSKEIGIVNNIKQVVDSVFNVLSIKEVELALLKDNNRSLVKSNAMMKNIVLEREVQLLNMLYMESVNRLELAKFNLLSSTPVLEIFDRPQYPIKPIEFGIIKGILLGGIGFGFLGVFIFGGLISLRSLKQILAET